jgi:hypothetical protein
MVLFLREASVIKRAVVKLVLIKKIQPLKIRIKKLSRAKFFA